MGAREGLCGCGNDPQGRRLQQVHSQSTPPPACCPQADHRTPRACYTVAASQFRYKRQPRQTQALESAGRLLGNFRLDALDALSDASTYTRRVYATASRHHGSPSAHVTPSRATVLTRFQLPWSSCCSYRAAMHSYIGQISHYGPNYPCDVSL